MTSIFVATVFIVLALTSGNAFETRSRGCPSNVAVKVQRCAAPIQRMNERVNSGNRGSLQSMCSTMTRGIRCLENLMNRCPDNPEVAMMSRMMNMDQLRPILNARCNGGPMPTYEPVPSNANCPSDYAQTMQGCMMSIQRLSAGRMTNVAAACRIVPEKLDCISEILNECPSKPEVQAIASLINVDDMRNILTTQCSAISSGGADGCPANYQSQMLGCLQPIIDMSDDATMPEFCSITGGGLQCFDVIVEQCRNNSEAQVLVASVGEIDDLRPVVAQSCGSGGQPEPEPTAFGFTRARKPRHDDKAGPCSNVQETLLQCNRILNQGQVTGDVCGDHLPLGFACINQLRAACPNDQHVVSFEAKVDMEEAAAIILHHCENLVL